MKYTNIFEKILFLFQVIGTSWMYIAFIAITIFSILLLALKKISKRKCFLLTSISSTVLFGFTIYNNYEPISKMMSNLIDNIFTNIYFPSAYAYLFILILINIATIGSLLKPRGQKVYKTINSICLIITNFTLTLILEVIAKNEVDIFSKTSLFANTDLITLLEFSINIFIGWLITLLAAYAINNITERITVARENKKLATNPAVTIAPAISIEEPKLKEEYQSTKENTPRVANPVQAIAPKLSENKFIPNFTVATPVVEENKFIPNFTVATPVVEENKFIPVQNTNNAVNNYNHNNNFDLSAFIPKKQDVSPINTLNTNTNHVFEQIINNELPVIKEEPKQVSFVEEQKNTYTLNDYKIFNKMLKDIREHNGSNSIIIDKNLEYRLITKYSTKNYDMFKTMLKIYSN